MRRRASAASADSRLRIKTPLNHKERVLKQVAEQRGPSSMARRLLLVFQTASALLHSRTPALRRTVRRLGDEFLGNDVIFPVARLCRMLEHHAAQGSKEPEWAVETLLEVGGDAQRAQLFRQSYGAVTAMVNEALAPSAQLRLLESVRALLERWVRFYERLFRQQVSVLLLARIVLASLLTLRIVRATHAFLFVPDYGLRNRVTWVSTPAISLQRCLQCPKTSFMTPIVRAERA